MENNKKTAAWDLLEQIGGYREEFCTEDTIINKLIGNLKEVPKDFVLHTYNFSLEEIVALNNEGIMFNGHIFDTRD
tara:strand:+ start:29583 stop:29810 length:228 start_codon:yes stop_codon:yes gene_type:complete